MYYHKGDKVRLIKIPEGLRESIRLTVGMNGEVIAVRPLIDTQVLVKFKGKSSLVSIDTLELERR